MIPEDATRPSAGPQLVPTHFATVAALLCALALAFGVLHLTRAVSAPEVKITTLAGEHLDTQAMHGHVVLVNFWATSCVYCIHEMPGVVRTYEKYHGQGFEVLAVAMSYDPPSYVLDYATSRQLPFKVALDLSGEIAKQFGNVEATPTSFLIDQDGKIIGRYEGELDFEALERSLDRQFKIAKA